MSLFSDDKLFDEGLCNIFLDVWLVIIQILGDDGYAMVQASKEMDKAGERAAGAIEELDRDKAGEEQTLVLLAFVGVSCLSLALLLLFSYCCYLRRR